MTPFRLYLIHRHFRKKKIPSGGELDEIEIILLPLRTIEAESPGDALNTGYLLLPTFRGRLCVGPLPTAHVPRFRGLTQETQNAPSPAEVE